LTYTATRPSPDPPSRRRQTPTNAFPNPLTGISLQGFVYRDNYPCEEIPAGIYLQTFSSTTIKLYGPDPEASVESLIRDPITSIEKYQPKNTFVNRLNPSLETHIRRHQPKYKS
jgi:hypothetical protein